MNLKENEVFEGLRGEKLDNYTHFRVIGRQKLDNNTDFPRKFKVLPRPAAAYLLTWLNQKDFLRKQSNNVFLGGDIIILGFMMGECND